MKWTRNEMKWWNEKPLENKKFRNGLLLSEVLPLYNHLISNRNSNTPWIADTAKSVSCAEGSKQCKKCQYRWESKWI